MPENETEKMKLPGQFGALERLTFVSDLLKKQIEIRNMLDLRTNIMIGFNSALVVFLAANFDSGWFGSVFFVVFLGVVIISMFSAVMALKPSHFSSKRGQKESFFYHHHISRMSEEEYKKEIFAVLTDEQEIYDNYVREIYNLTRYSNVPRKFYLNLSIRILLYGILIALFLHGLSILTNSIF